MNSQSQTLYAGVVEGFYGRPWTFKQRCDLFERMARWGLNTYLYAPKDDDKHRAYWRELYSLEEADEISTLIKECTSQGLRFIYGIAPGLNITFSNERDAKYLRDKLDQIGSLGCKHFAILFDDIDFDLCGEDAAMFGSFANAQVTVTNDLYAYLKEPDFFLFCPTEYCSSLAEPSVKESPYLEQIGTDLHPKIEVLWTGPRVISKEISVESIKEITEVIKRPPVIWDNLHANDYDQRRLFLGPYSGRSPEVLPLIHGVLTNPNCEYHANYMAISTMIQWCKGLPSVSDEDALDDSASTKDESEPLDGVHSMKPVWESTLRDWLKDFNQSVQRTDKKPANPPVSSKTVPTSSDVPISHPDSNAHDGRVEGDSINSRNDNDASNDEDDKDSAMQQSPAADVLDGTKVTSKSSEVFGFDDLKLLVDLFHLPHKHGEQARRLLMDFDWLKYHAPGHRALDIHRKRQEELMEDSGKEKESTATAATADGDSHELHKVPEWLARAESFHQQCKAVCKMFARLTGIPNRPLLYDIYQYIWDAKETCMLLDSYISWLEAGGYEVRKEGYLPATVEPFVFKGGITAEMQRLLPTMDSPKDLYSMQKAPCPSPLIFTIRPYRPEDKALAYRVCLETGDSGADGTKLFPHYPNLLGDRYVGPYVTLSQELSFVLEDDEGVCGYVLAALDSRQFYKQFKEKWTPSVIGDYPSGDEGLTPEEKDVLGNLRQSEFFLPAELYDYYPSHLHIDLMKRAQGKGTGGRMIRCVLSALKAKGSCGVHLEMSINNSRALKFYLKLGFVTLDFAYDSTADDVLILGRTL
ncbi:protein O-GlcNAcase-like isoform X2 [Dysidea avara]|uniref:protein O-GlcNAcase-like isoform X2 n=1 Tax=Dysidea avara TaxID=196820 RepID=UPI003333F676